MRASQFIPAFPHLRFDLRGLPQNINRVGSLVHLEIELAQGGQDQRVVGIELEALQKIGLALQIIALIHRHAAKLKVDSGIARRELLNFLKSRTGLIIEFKLIVRHAELEVRIHRVRLDLHRLLKLLNGQRQVLAIECLISWLTVVGILAIGAAQAVGNLVAGLTRHKSVLELSNGLSVFLGVQVQQALAIRALRRWSLSDNRRSKWAGLDRLASHWPRLDA